MRSGKSFLGGTVCGDEENYYVLLHIAQEATVDEIKHAYRKRAREVHPDANRDDPDAGKKFKAVKKAYDALSDPTKRAEHDAELRCRSAASTAGDDDLDSSTPNTPDHRPLPPHLSDTEVHFQLVEGDYNSIPQVRVRITNPNANPALWPVLQPSGGQFWWTQLYVDGERWYFAISPRLSDIGTGVYGDSLEVHWEGIPDLTTTLDISLTVTPRSPEPPSYNAFAGNGAQRPAGNAVQQSPFVSHREPRRSLAGAILLFVLGLVFLVGPPLLSQLSYFQQADSSPNPGRDVAAVLLFIVWLGGSVGCFYGVYRLIDEWRSADEKRKRQRSWLTRLFTGNRRAQAMSTLALICLVVPPAVVLPLYVSQHNIAKDFNTVVVIVLLGLIFIIGTPAFFYEARRVRRSGR